MNCYFLLKLLINTIIDYSRHHINSTFTGVSESVEGFFDNTISGFNNQIFN